MAYCPKCGVEVEDDVKCCPLCDFPIPDVNDGNYPHDAKYPQAINTYDEDHLGKKNKAFFSLTIIAISIMVIIGVIYLVYPWNHELLKYIALADLSIFAIVFLPWVIYSRITIFWALILRWSSPVYWFS